MTLYLSGTKTNIPWGEIFYRVLVKADPKHDHIDKKEYKKETQKNN